MTKSEKKGLIFYLFKKRYPAWVYGVALGIFAIILYIWIQYMLEHIVGI